MNLDLTYMIEILPNLLIYVPVTLYLTFASMLLGIIFGGAAAIVLRNDVPIIKPIIRALVSFFRGTPPLVQLLLVFFGLPQLFPMLNNLSAIHAVIFTFSLNTAAYLAEVFRAALDSVDKGQVEAAISVGLSYGQTLRGIVLPQAMRNAIPATGNTLVSLLKNTSLAFTIGVVEILAQAQLIASSSLRFFEAYFVVGLIYWGLAIIFSWCQNWLEKRVNLPYEI